MPPWARHASCDHCWRACMTQRGSSPPPGTEGAAPPCMRWVVLWQRATADSLAAQASAADSMVVFAADRCRAGSQAWAAGCRVLPPAVSAAMPVRLHTTHDRAAHPKHVLCSKHARGWTEGLALKAHLTVPHRADHPAPQAVGRRISSRRSRQHPRPPGSHAWPPAGAHRAGQGVSACAAVAGAVLLAATPSRPTLGSSSA